MKKVITLIVFSISLGAYTQENINDNKFRQLTKTFLHLMFIEQQLVHLVMNITNNKRITRSTLLLMIQSREFMVKKQ